MSTGKRLVAAALGGACLAALLSASLVARAGEPMALTMAPMRAQSLDVGPKHIVVYFLGDDGSQCRLTLMISDVGDDTTFLASRLQLVVDAGRSASLDTAHGASLAFNCDNRAQTMRVTRIDRFTGAREVD